MIMKVFLSKKPDSLYQFIFIHGWGGNEKSLYNLASLFFNKYSCHLLCLSGFGDQIIDKPYTVSDYVDEIEKYIEDNNLKNVVIIGHSFGGKIAFFLKLRHQEYQIITLAPSIRKNPFSLWVNIKIILYKIFKKLHLPIFSFLLGSRDYQNSSSFLRKTFLNVHHYYLNNEQLKQIKSALIIGFKQDKEVNYKVLKKVANDKIKFILKDGDHFAYQESLLEIYHIIMCYIKGQ